MNRIKKKIKFAISLVFILCGILTLTSCKLGCRHKNIESTIFNPNYCDECD